MELLDSKTAYEGFVADVLLKRYRRAGGTEVERQVIEHPGSVAILAHDDEALYLVRQPREAVEEDGLLEIPAGTLDVAGEGELECARATIFEATGLSEAQSNPDEDEEIEVVRWPRADLDGAIAAVEDATTLVALLMLRQRRRAR